MALLIEVFVYQLMQKNTILYLYYKRRNSNFYQRIAFTKCILSNYKYRRWNTYIQSIRLKSRVINKLNLLSFYKSLKILYTKKNKI